jgi:hypothetical protein
MFSDSGTGCVHIREQLRENYNHAVTTLIHKEIRAKIQPSYGGYRVDEFFERGELRDVLDSITLVYKIVARDSSGRGEAWKEFLNVSCVKKTSVTNLILSAAFTISLMKSLSGNVILSLPASNLVHVRLLSV